MIGTSEIICAQHIKAKVTSHLDLLIGGTLNKTKQKSKILSCSNFNFFLVSQHTFLGQIYTSSYNHTTFSTVLI